MLMRWDMLTRETLPPASARHPAERCLGGAGAAGADACRFRV